MRFLVPFLLLPVALPAYAQEAVDPLIAALSMDWNADEAPDAILLTLGSEDSADIQVYEGNFNGLQPILTVPDAVFAGPWAGQAQGLERLTETSFAVTSEQTGIGPTPWMGRVTVAYRDGALVVAGFTHDFYDRLDPDHWGTCDVNLLTGTFEIRKGPGTGEIRDDETPLDAPETIETGRVDPASFPLSDLTSGYFSPVCDALYR